MSALSPPLLLCQDVLDSLVPFFVKHFGVEISHDHESSFLLISARSRSDDAEGMSENLVEIELPAKCVEHTIQALREKTIKVRLTK